MIKRFYLFSSIIVVFIFVYSLFYGDMSLAIRSYLTQRDIIEKSAIFENSENAIDNWRCINKSVCIYSAYWEERFIKPFVFLVAIVPKNVNVSSWECLFKHNGTLEEVPLKMKAIPESHGKSHKAVFLLCYTKYKPKRVEITAGNLSIHSIRVKETKADEDAKRKLAVCVRPIFGKFPNNNSLIAEFLAYYHELGVDHFIFYNYQSDLSLKVLFYELKKNGFPIDFLPWNLPQKFSEAWGYGQMAFNVDCLYRNSQNYEFVAILDVDEFIVPKEDVSLKELIKRVNRKGSKWGTYMFRQTFFCLEYEDDPSSVNLTISLVTQTKTRHERKLWPYFDRSKCIFRPAAVIVPAIHFSWIQLKSWKTLLVNNKVALLHHYRANKCEIDEGDEGIIETRMKRYGKRILDSLVFEIWKRLYLI